MEKTNPIAVCISDIHFNINNLELSSTALTKAIEKSNELKIPLVVAGDLHDTKAIIRAEVANRLLSIFEKARELVFLLVGNHDLINEKDRPHSLNIYRHRCHIIDTPTDIGDITLIPYQSSPEAFLELIRGCQGIVVCHQGVQGAYMGDYVQDKTSIDPNHLNHLKVISGHYHKHQTVGALTYIGSPFTMTWGEANDGDKGFLILNSDGSYTREILDLRRHIIHETTPSKLLAGDSFDKIRDQDLLWVKVRGTKSELESSTRDQVAQVFGRKDFKLDLTPNSVKNDFLPKTREEGNEILDQIIDNSNETAAQKAFLKQLWRDIYK